MRRLIKALCLWLRHRHPQSPDDFGLTWANAWDVAEPIVAAQGLADKDWAYWNAVTSHWNSPWMRQRFLDGTEDDDT